MENNSSQSCNTSRRSVAIKSSMVSGLRTFGRALWFVVMGEFSIHRPAAGKSSILRRLIGIFVSTLGANALANPHGMTVVSGSATSHANGSQLNINTSQTTVLNWQSFNIAAGESTIFNQPNAGSLVINNIHDANASQIYGSLQANGMVVLMNPSGFYFGPSAFIQTGSLIVSTASSFVPPPNAGGSWEFNGPPPLSSIINYGKIEVGNHGSAFLIADTVENNGVISAPGGSIGLVSGQTVMLSDRPDGRGLSAQVTLPQGSVDNAGKLIADAGVISMQAQVVNQNGLVQANSAVNKNGVIELVASDTLNLGANSQITANGDASTPGSSGGEITLEAGNNFSDSAGSEISTTGGSQGGNGGSIEISAPNFLSLDSKLDASALSGWTSGDLFLDPNFIVLGSSGSGSTFGGTVLAGDPPATGTLSLNVNTAFTGFSQILLQANQDITLATGTQWDLSQTTGENSGILNLEAGRNIILGNGSLLSDANGWSANLYAGYNFGSSSVTPGTGSILINGNTGVGGSIRLGSGDLNMTAGQNITVGSGSVITTAGGDIMAHALTGSIDTGSDPQGYHFNRNAGSLDNAYTVSQNLGGISTETGGDVTLIAGGNVTSILPGRNGNNGYFYNGNFVSDNPSTADPATAGAGAYGRTAAGSVTIIAGGNVTGNYVVADGTGSIFAGVKMDANGNPITDGSGHYVLGATGSAGTVATKPNLSLDLVSGGWNVTAAQNIFLEGVFNPNGAFDSAGGPTLNHTFDYTPGSFANLTAGNEVQLGAASSTLWLAGSTLPFIYPPILNIQSGAGGVALGTSGSPNSLILYPSPEGSLTINTTGSLFSNLNPTTGPQIFSLIVSDSGANQWKSSATFAAGDHAATPIHENNPTPIDLNIGGDMSLVSLSVPEAAQINVAGNMNNCGFQGMNLAANDVTSIQVGGDINNASTFTTINLNNISGGTAPDFTILGQAITPPGQPSAATLASSFFYDPLTGVLTYRTIPGVNLASVLNLLQHLTIQTYINGIPQWADPPDNTIPITEPFPVTAISATDAAALLAQVAIAGAVPANDSLAGFNIGGGGKFNLSARNIDLGTTAGIESLGVGFDTFGNNFPLANLFGNGGVFNRGADISVTAQQNLTMFSSSIASLNGGNISVDAGGNVTLGSSQFTVNSSGARGIYTTSGGDVSVIGGGGINVNGSRIATYNGGNITVESLNGDVNAGTGASVPVSIEAFYEDPATHEVFKDSPQQPFAGIAALTFDDTDANFPAPPATLGNILVEAPNGDVNANVSGIIQIPLNHQNYPNAVTAVLAGSELRDSSGNPLTAADLGTPTVQGNLATAAAGEGGQTVVLGGQHIEVSSVIWTELSTLLGLSPTAEQVIQLDVSGNASDFIAALTGNVGGLANFSYSTQVSGGRNINAIGSGIIASNARLGASGNINGLIFARNNIDVNAQQNINITALGVGNVNVSGNSITGNIIGVGSVNVSGASIDASLESANVSGSTSGQSGLGEGNAAASASQGASASGDSETKQQLASSDSGDSDDKKKRGRGEPTVMRRTGRVTVILPKAQG